jgi:hypothetical protein
MATEWAAWALRVESFDSLYGWYHFMHEARKATLPLDFTALVGNSLEVASVPLPRADGGRQSLAAHPPRAAG